MSPQAREAWRTAINVAVFAAAVYFTTPGRTPIAPYVWHTGARAAHWWADECQAWAERWRWIGNELRSQYWKSLP